MKTHKQYRYRIYTEDKIGMGRYKIQKIIADCFEGFTIFGCIGVWKNKVENSCVIEIITPRRSNDIIRLICVKINQINSQECCLVTIEKIEATYAY